MRSQTETAKRYRYCGKERDTERFIVRAPLRLMSDWTAGLIRIFALQQGFGHPTMGIYARVVSGGPIAVGDAIAPAA